MTAASTQAACEATARLHAARVQAYLDIGGPHMPAGQAAVQLGVTRRTIVRYRAELKARGLLAVKP